MTKEDYIGEDGLLHCGTCGEAKEAYIPKIIFGGKIVVQETADVREKTRIKKRSRD